jgi:hypothetical protein
MSLDEQAIDQLRQINERLAKLLDRADAGWCSPESRRLIS